MIYLKTDDEIELLPKANLLVSATLAEIAKVVKPGVSTRELDTLANNLSETMEQNQLLRAFLILMVHLSLLQFVLQSMKSWFTESPMMSR